MKSKILISQKIFDEAVAVVREHFEVEWNQSETPLSPSTLIQRLQDKKGTIILLTDRIDEAVLPIGTALHVAVALEFLKGE